MANDATDLSALVVDDEADLAHELADTLRGAGIRTVVAHSGQQARAILDADTGIGAVVTDVGMPGGDGFSIARWIMMETKPEHARRVVIMTGQSRLDHVGAAVRAGAMDYLRKPFTAEEMIGAVARALAASLDKRMDHARRVSTLRELADAHAETESMRLRDVITGLPNDLALERSLQLGGHDSAALLMIRLGGLQFLDAAGLRSLREALLRAASARFQGVVARQNLFALREPAHFAVLGAGVSQPNAFALGHALADALGPPLVVDGHMIDLTVAVGVSHRVGATEGPPLDGCAQVAMAEAARLGGSRVIAFSTSMHGDALRRLRISQCLPRAAAEGQFALHYQPLRTADLTRLSGYEALLRWTHPTLGEVRPDEFIAAAEETGAILDLGAWVARAAVRQVARWRQSRHPAIHVGINVSGRQLLEADVPGLLAELLAEHRVPADAVLVEVTETVAMGEGAAAALEALRSMGLRVALDDFGAGFSSLGALRRLPADVVKFDRSLLPNGARQEPEAHFYRNLVATVRGLGFDIVSEGIETEAQRLLAAYAGASLLQGYLIGRPGPPT